MVALYTIWYNYVRQHKAHKLSPAMAAGLTDKLMDMADLVVMIDEREEEQKRAAIRARFENEHRARQRLSA